MEEEGAYALLVGRQIGAAPVENGVGDPQEIIDRNSEGSGNSTAGYLPEDNKNTNSKRCMLPRVHQSIVGNTRDIGRTQVSTDG